MFNQKGYFKTSPCPKYCELSSSSETCTRANCPFRHLDSDKAEEKARMEARDRLEAKEQKNLERRKILPKPQSTESTDSSSSYHETDKTKDKKSPHDHKHKSKGHSSSTKVSSSASSAGSVQFPSSSSSRDRDHDSGSSSLDPSQSRPKFSKRSSSENSHSSSPTPKLNSKTDSKPKEQNGKTPEKKKQTYSTRVFVNSKFKSAAHVEEIMNLSASGALSPGPTLDEDGWEIPDIPGANSPEPEDMNDELIEMECREIFDNYANDQTQSNTSSKTNGDFKAPTQIPSSSKTKNPAEDDYTNPVKKIRLAPTYAEVAASPAKASPQLVPRKHIPTPKEAMAQRYLHFDSSAAKATPKQRPMRRISAVGNVSAYVNSNNNNRPKPQASTPTLARTVDKGSKRVPHTPKPKVKDFQTLPIPWDEGYDVPVLTLTQIIQYSKIDGKKRQSMIEKIWTEIRLTRKDLSPEELDRVTLEIEEKIASRASKTTYTNLGINWIYKFRKQTQSQVAGAAIDGIPVTSQSSDTDTSSSSGKQSHLATIAGAAGARNSWSIEKRTFEPITHGNKLYTALLDYLLTEKDLLDNGFPLKSPDKNSVIREPNPLDKGKKKLNIKVPGPNFRVCDRCSELYEVHLKTGLPVKSEECNYHHGKSFPGRPYTCCGDEDADSKGCCFSSTHVPVTPQLVSGFVTLIKEPGDEATMGEDPWDVVAIDCEMIYTSWGSELARVTVVGADKSVLYDQLVRPVHPILDYNTRFSGITEADMAGVKTTILDVQAVLLTRLKRNSILIGHSLESDLFALKLKHDRVIDTSVLFPHRRGPPYKKGLKTLSADYLERIIQTGEGGHDNKEDALAALDMALWKINSDAKAGVTRTRKLSTG